MESASELTASALARNLAIGEVLIAQGAPGGDLFVLESGELTVERDGVVIATIATPNAIVGEMSVILGKPSSATVRVTQPATVLVIENARGRLDSDPKLTFRLAKLMATRLDATSAYLAELNSQNTGKVEKTLLERISAALHLQDGQTAVLVNRNDLFRGPGELD